MWQVKVRRVRSYRSHQGHKFEITRGDNTRIYENPSIPSRVRMTQLLQRLVDLGKGLVTLSSFDWTVSGIEGR